MELYDHKKIEAKWQAEWERSGIYRALDEGEKAKFYCLVEFPYPSGDGLHVGHVRPYIGLDIIARKRRMGGYNVLYPMGWDAFGLPTENYAIKTGIQPAVVTKQNTDNFRRQIKMLGASFDWSREINTTDPKYYKWTQWIFLRFFKKGLAYKAKSTINWCPKDKIGLANEEVVAGKCERCGTEVERREKEQWLLAITKYADRLASDLDKVDYPEPVKIQQRNWIGRSDGALIKFDDIEIFTTRPETIFGASFIAIPGKADRFTGEYVTNPANQEKLPVWETEYVLSEVGAGAIMGVPAHNQRDFEFAKKHNLPVVMVVCPYYPAPTCPILDAAYVGEGHLVASGELNGLTSEKARKVATDKFGVAKTTYKLRDWVFSRQRYWGEPIPMIFCEKCHWQAVPEKDLPVVLPKLEKFQPRDDGESPLASLTDWVKVKCPKCGGEARRETDTMPNWAGSSWYYLRYLDSENQVALAAPEKIKHWTPVDWYNGGMEHTTLHLLYSRFWHKFLFDINVVPDDEPYRKRTSHGLILAADGEKMSKSRGNVVNPDKIVKLYGADTLRLYEMFLGPFERAAVWNTESIIGPRRFLERVWKLSDKLNDNAGTSWSSFVKKITDDIEAMKFNTAVSSFMILVNQFEKNGVSKTDYEIFLKLLAPFAPHLTEELWHKLGHISSVHQEKWPNYVENNSLPENVTIVVQINGVIRDTLIIGVNADAKNVQNMALQSPKVKKWLDNKTIKRVVYVPRRLLNFVIYDNV